MLCSSKCPKYNIYTCLEISVTCLDKEEINTFCFINCRCLFPNDLHDNYIICTVECTFRLTIDVQSLTTLYILFAKIYLHR